MRYLIKIVLGILVFLALSSGITKVLLMEQEVEFFGAYGFSNPILITFGALQIISGIMLLMPRFRLVGAILLSVTFIVSFVILVLEQSLVPGLLTLVSLVFLAYIIHQTTRNKPVRSVVDAPE